MHSFVKVVAKELGIPVSMVRVKPTDNLVAPNNSVTGGSMGSECCASVSDLNNLIGNETL